jgi:Uma2 family endonuclease
MEPDYELQPRPMSFEEYLRFDAEHSRPVEYIAGVAYPRGSCTRRHNRINSNIAMALHDTAAELECHVFMSQMRVHVSEDTIAYPDVVVTCDAADNDEWTVFRPCLLVEIASRETAQIDYRAKSDAFRAMPTLQSYLIVSERGPQIQRWWRSDTSGRWLLETIYEGVVPVPCLEVELAVDQIYRNLLPYE